jgi:hypothetical protein
MLVLGSGRQATAAERPAKIAAGAAVDVFDAMKAGDIDVRLIPKDSTGGVVLVKNKSKKPLTIKMPEAFAGVPVAAQFGGGMGGMGGMGGGMGGMGGGMGGGMQAMGGGMGGMGGGMGGMGGMGMGMGGGGGFFNVEPGKERKLKIVCVCLEHGKEEPNPRVPYTIRPLETVASKQEVVELVRLLGTGRIDQQAAQASAWHLASGLSWNELAKKIKAKHLDGSTEPYFTRDQLSRAYGFANAAQSLAKDAKTMLVSAANSPGEELAKENQQQ